MALWPNSIRKAAVLPLLTCALSGCAISSGNKKDLPHIAPPPSASKADPLIHFDATFQGATVSTFHSSEPIAQAPTATATLATKLEEVALATAQEALPPEPDSFAATPKTPTTTTSLTLDQVINATLLADPKLRAGFEAINQANGEALTASLLPNPSLNVVQSLMPLTKPFTVNQQGGPPQFDVGLSYPIDWFLFGKRAAALQAATLGVKVSEAEYADLVRQRVLEAATAYYDALEAKALLDLAKQDTENLKRVESVTQKAVEGGGRPQVELNRVRLDRLKSEQAVREAETTVVASLAKLRAVMGRADADATFALNVALTDSPTTELLSVEQAYAIAVQNRPDVSAQRWKLAQVTAGAEVERCKAFPEVTPQVGYTRQFQQKAIGFPDANSFGFGMQMTLPVSDRNQGNRLKAASVAVQQGFELQSNLTELRSEVTQAVQELQAAAANAKAVADEQLKLAADVRDSLNKAYEAGGRPLIDVLDAQRNYRETYRLFISSRANYGRASVKFNAVLGKKATP